MRILNLLFIILGLFIAISCQPRGERDGLSTPSNNQTGGGGGYDGPTGGGLGDSGDSGGSDNDDQYVDDWCNDDRGHNPYGEQPSSYPFYSYDVIAHGTTNFQTSQPPSEIFSWSSIFDVKITDQQQLNFISDSRFNVRVKVLPAPSMGLNDNMGVQCGRMNLPYSKLKFKVGIKDMNTGAIIQSKEVKYDGIRVGGCSDVLEFSPFATGSPIVLEIFEVYNDYECKRAQENNWNTTYRCPFEPTYIDNCFKVKVQVSTDHTMDFKPRY